MICFNGQLFVSDCFKFNMHLNHLNQLLSNDLQGRVFVFTKSCRALLNNTYCSEFVDDQMSSALQVS